MVVGAAGGDAAPARALDESGLEEVRLVYVLHRVARLAQRDRDRPDPHRAAVELVDDQAEVVAVGAVEAEVVDALHLQRPVRRLLVYRAVAHDLRVVAHALEEPVGDARCAPAAAGELPGAALRDRDAENPGVADHDLLQVLRRVVVQPRVEPEPVQQGLRHEAGARRRPDEGEAREVHPDRARRGPLPEHEVHREVLHRRIEDLFDLAVEAVDLVYKQEVALVEGGQDRRHVPRPLQARPARGLQPHPHLGGEDAAQRGLAEARRPGEEDVVERFPTLLGRLHEDSQVLLEPLLPDELLERARPQRRLVVLRQRLRVQRVLVGRPDWPCRSSYILSRLVAVRAAHGEVVHLLHAYRLLPIRLSASLM